MAHTPQLCHQGHALWCIVEQDCYGCNSLCSKTSPADCSGSQCIPPCASTGAQPICGLLALRVFPCAGHRSIPCGGHRSIPCGGHRSIPLWKSQEQSPVEATGAQPPLQGGCYLLAQGACPKQFTNPFLSTCW